VRNLLNLFPAALALLVLLYEPFLALLAQEGLLVDALKGSALTERLAELDRLIDRLLTGINNVVQAGLHHFDSARVNAANRVYLRLKAFGDIENKSYEGESAALGILITDLRTHYAVDIEILGLVEWLDQLEAAHLEFDALFNQRNMEWADRPDVNLKDIRRQIDALYRQMVDRINAAALLDVEGIYDELIRQLNREITYFNDHMPHHAKKDIAHVTVADIQTQLYTGKPVIYIPTVFFTETGKPAVELIFAKDFTVTYKDNVEVGTATLIIHGKGAYKGTKTVTFNIAAQIEN
jgi:hypothetical protein